MPLNMQQMPAGYGAAFPQSQQQWQQAMQQQGQPPIGVTLNSLPGSTTLNSLPQGVMNSQTTSAGVTNPNLPAGYWQQQGAANPAAAPASPSPSDKLTSASQQQYAADQARLAADQARVAAPTGGIPESQQRQNIGAALQPSSAAAPENTQQTSPRFLGPPQQNVPAANPWQSWANQAPSWLSSLIGGLGQNPSQQSQTPSWAASGQMPSWLSGLLGAQRPQQQFGGGITQGSSAMQSPLPPPYQIPYSQ